MKSSKLLIGVSLSWLLALACSSVFWTDWETRWTDSWLVKKAPAQKLDDRILLVLIDDKTIERIPQPTAYWLPLLGKVTRSSLEQGAAAVAWDWMPHEVDEKTYKAVFEKGWGQPLPWTDLGEAANRFPGRWIQGIFPHLDRSPGQDYRPASVVMALAGRDGLAYLNLSRDKDGILRSQVAAPLKLDDPFWSGEVVPSFAARVAEAGSKKSVSGPEVIPVAFCEPGRFPRVSLCDLLDSSDDGLKLNKIVEGKILLLGAGTPLFQDLVTTPVGQMLGIEAQANCLNTLLTGSLVKPVDPVLYWLFVGALSLFFAELGVRLAPWQSLLALLGWGALSYQVCSLLFVRYDLVVMLSPLALGPLVALLAGGFQQWFYARREQARVRNLFGRYVSPSVMEELIKDPSQAALGAVCQREIAVLFTDINGFSTVCEKKSPAEIMVMLNVYFSEMNRIIFDHGGTIKQFVGDEIMAMFGAPQPQPRAEQKALETAVAMVRRLRILSAADPEGQGFYQIKIGLHRGSVILGNVGSEQRTEYAAVGDDVNLGSRIMGMNKALGADFLISSDFAKEVTLPDGVSLRSKGAHTVKGRVEPVEIFEVVVDE
ncbi:adenylate/guanylate cyclase domain-containing protein [bacterium]|nr:adenylate/guanylate cyclase domain-containing protein [bacterium]